MLWRKATTMVERMTRTRRVVMSEEAFGALAILNLEWGMRNGIRAFGGNGIRLLDCFAKCLFILSKGLASSAHPVVEGVLEAGEFAKEGIVTRVGVRFRFNEEAEEGGFRIESAGCGREEPGEFETGPGDLDEAELGRGAPGDPVGEALAEQFCGRQVVE